MTKLSKLKKTCPCDVINQTSYFIFLGQYRPLSKTIFIDPEQTEATQFAVLTHEKQHAICHENGCFCFRPGKQYWREYHAFKAELCACLDYPAALKWLTPFFKKEANSYKNGPHRKACRNLMKTKLWRKVLERVKNGK